MRTLTFAFLSLGLTLVGCDDAPAAPDATVTTDAGAWDAGSPPAPMDAGADDAGPPDSGRADGGVDAGTSACAATITPEAFLEAYGERLCELYTRCAPYVSSSQRWSCHRGLWRELSASVRERLASGELLLDGDVACGCLDRLAAPTCDTFWLGLEACIGSWEHPVAPTACGDPSDCNPGQLCVRDGTCPGRCEDLPSAGEPCDVACDWDSRCVDGTCEALRRLGEPCDSDHRCDHHLSCEGGVCRGPAAAGEPCGGGAYCQAGLTCSDDVCGAGRPEGASCFGARDRCALGLRCLDEVCVRAALPGEACALDEECPEGHRCDGTCQPRPLVGDPCPDGDCYAGRCEAGTCVPSALGDACDPVAFFANQCGDEAYCDFDTERCERLAALGEDCNAPPCADGLECDADSGTCVAACVVEE